MLTSLIIVAISQVVNAPQMVLSLDAGAPIWDVVTEDLNQDGFLDVIAVCCDKETTPMKRYVAVFLATPEGTYPNTPSLTYTLPATTGALFLAEWDNNPPRELVVASTTEAEILAFHQDGWRTEKNITLQSLFPTGAKEPVFLRETAKDLDNDSIDEWFIPVAGGYQIFWPSTGDAVTVTCDIESEIRRGENVYIYHRLPAYHVFSVPEMSSKAIAFLSDQFADFAYGDRWQQQKQFKIPLRVNDKWDASVRMADVDKNGLPDLIVTQTKGTVNLVALTQVYLARAPFEYNDKPDVTYETKGALASPFLKDVNGDNLDDLVFVKIPLGVRAFMNYFLRRKLTVEVDVYLYQGDGYSATPDFTQTLVLDAPEGREQVAYTMGDFNADKRLDVAIGIGAGNMLVYTGVAGKFLNQKPWVTLEIPSFGVARSVDLNKNGNDDILLFHPGMGRNQFIEIALF